MNWQELRTAARERFHGACRVCPACNGAACAGEVPGMGGIGTGAAFKNNVSALAAYGLNMRVIHAVTSPDPAVTVLGQRLVLPVLGAPMGGIAFNMGGARTEEEFTHAIVSGCRQAGTLGMTGDGPNPAFFAAGLAAIRQENGLGIPVIKPRPNEDVVRLAQQAAAAGAVAFAVDVDAAALVNMVRQGQPVGPKTAQDLAYIKEHTALPFIVKGIMTPDDAYACCQAGVDAIVVSNHGGRSLDYTPGTAAVLPEIAKIVKGKLTVLVDGGIRSGVDVLKCLALGADAVLVGRPLAVGAVGGGADGVALVLARLADELRAAMLMTGTSAAAHVPSTVVRRIAAAQL